MSSIRRNFMYNLLYQIIIMFIPLITIPYVSRIFQNSGIGIYSYSLSITQYFIMFGTLGITLYGSREVAYVKEDRKTLSRTFWEITILKIGTTAGALILYCVICYLANKSLVIYGIQSINIIAAMIDITWLYTGMEDFKRIVLKNLFIRVLGVISIFLFVKSYNDLYLFIGINAMSVLVGNLLMWFGISEYIDKVSISNNGIRSRIKPVIKIFIPQIAIQIYSVVDKTMLGYFTDMSQVGLYEQSQKIIVLILSIVTTLGTVMMPRMSNIYANNENKKMEYYLNKILVLVLGISIPTSFGIAAISEQMVPWFLGDSFKGASILIAILSPIIIFISISNVLGMQYLMPSNRVYEFTKSVVAGAIVNIILNIILINKFKAIGACISTVFAECVVTSLQCKYLSDKIKVSSIRDSCTKYLLSSIIMMIIISKLGQLLGVGLIANLIQIVIGIGLYLIFLLAFREKIITTIVKRILNLIRS